MKCGLYQWREQRGKHGVITPENVELLVMVRFLMKHPPFKRVLEPVPIAKGS